MSTFASAEHVTEGWYVAERSRNIARGKIHTVPIGRREIVVYRKGDGTPVALDAHCPHLGAHLSMGRLREDGVECAFHGWRWGHEGLCVEAPGCDALQRRTRAYPALERWGFLWVWIGNRPPYALPEPGAPPSWRIVRPPPRNVRCHPHLMIGNGHDLGHFRALHEFTVDSAKTTQEGDHALTVETSGELPHVGAVKLFRLGGKRYHAHYTTYGGSIVHVTVHAPIRFETIFTGRPTAEGHTRAQTLAFVPSLALIPRAIAIIAGTTSQDIPLLESVRFRPAYEASDESFVRYAKLVEALPTW